MALGEGIFHFFLQTVPSKCVVKCKFPFVSVPLPRVLHSGKKAFPECHPSPSAMGFATLGKPLFPECISSPSATLGEDWLPRVPDFWHSGKTLALGEFRFSRSASSLCWVDYRRGTIVASRGSVVRARGHAPWRERRH
jgi:hypothetical protein